MLPLFAKGGAKDLKPPSNFFMRNTKGDEKGQFLTFYEATKGGFGGIPY